MPYDALEVIKHRNLFYRDSYRKLVVALLIMLCIVVALSITTLLMMVNRPQPTYFAATDTGRIIPLVPLGQPNLSDKALQQWASEAVTSVFSYNFLNFRQAFQDNKKYFTDEGWRGLLQALEAAQTLQMVQTKKLVVSAVLSGAPVITNQYLLHGRYTWRIQMPLLVTYESANEHTDQRLMISLTIKRVSTLDNIFGVGITSFIAEQK
jgi:intracellular multiplication protein IcmL